MGKVEDMRRLREQRAAASTAAASTAAAAPRRASTQAAPPVRATATPEAVVDAAAEGLCGHTSISGRSCTRERDHQKAGTKNHRYG